MQYRYIEGAHSVIHVPYQYITMHIYDKDVDVVTSCVLALQIGILVYN